MTHAWTWATRAMLGAWVVIALGTGGCLLALHLLAMPAPDRADLRLAAGIDLLAGPHEGWQVFHFISADCRCSSRVLERLTSRGVVADREVLVFVGAFDASELSRARQRGFEVVLLDERSAEGRFGAVATPLMVVRSPRHEIVYVGGYTHAKQAPFIADLHILAALRAGDVVAPLPLFGCPISDRLTQRVDPLGLRSRDLPERIQ